MAEQQNREQEGLRYDYDDSATTEDTEKRDKAYKGQAVDTPDVAMGLDDREFLDRDNQEATDEDEEKNNTTRVTTLSNDEFDPS